MDLLPHEADIAEQVRHKITGANLAYDLFTNNNYNKLTLYAASQSVNRESYYGAQQDPNAYGHTEDFTGSFGAQYVLNVDEFLFAPSSTIFGLDNNFNRLKDEKMGVDGPNTEISNQLVNTFGSFIQHDWKSDNVNVSLGARFDNYLIRDLNSVIEDRAEDISELVVAPRLSAMYKISKDLRFRASYAKGYRAPQVFNEDLHIEMVNARRVIHINSEDLTRETSHSITSSVNYSFGKGEFVSDILIEGFYTKLQDAFADDHFEIDSSGTWGYKRVNAENGAHVAGINFEYNGSLVKRLDFQAGFTLQQSQFEDAQQWGDQPESKTKDFVRSPDQYGFVTLSWYPFEKFQTTLSMNYTGPMHVPHFGGESTSMADLQKMQNHIHELEQSIINASSISQINELESKLGEQKAKYQNAKLINKAIEDEDIIEGEKLEISKEFFALDLMFSYKLQLSRETNLSIYAGIKNLLNQTQNDHDRGVFRDAGYIYGPCQPRMLNFGLKFSNVFH
jgi:outer membrane receptor for ferrienterochelin and colicins